MSLNRKQQRILRLAKKQQRALAAAALKKTEEEIKRFQELKKREQTATEAMRTRLSHSFIGQTTNAGCLAMNALLTEQTKTSLRASQEKIDHLNKDIRALEAKKEGLMKSIRSAQLALSVLKSHGENGPR